MSSEMVYYHYDPSEVLSGIVAGLFGISFLVSLVQTIRKRSWVWSVMVLAILMEVIGYIVRIRSAQEPTERGPYVVQFTTIILAPVLMAGVIYVIFSRMVFWAVPPELRTMSYLWSPPRFITLIFVTFDVVSLLLQLVAAVLIAGTDPEAEDAQERADLGRALGLVGVGVQMVGFGIFSIVSVRFQITSRRLDRSFSQMNGVKCGINKDWARLPWVINIACVLILIRSVFRLIEFAGGREGQVHEAEWYLYVFDTLPILIVVLAFNIWFPGDYLGYLGFRLPKDQRSVNTNDSRGARGESFGMQPVPPYQRV